MGRPKNVYRGKRKYRAVITVLLFIMAFVIVAGVWLFDYMQRFIVYDKDGLTLELPFMESESAVGDAPEEENMISAPPVDVEIIVEEPDFSDVDLGAGEGLESLHARYILADSMSSENLSYYAFELASKEQNAMVLQLKTSGGYFSYLSNVPMASSYGVNGSEDIREAIAALKEQGVYLVAEISTLQDDAMAVRNSPLALKTSSGEVAEDSSGSWLDPYNSDVRSYITDIMAELADMGFDEVLLTGLAHPQIQDIVFSKSMTEAPSIASSVSIFALRMSESARELGLKCSVLCQANKLRDGTSADIGQDLELFFKFFDRVYVHTEMDYLAVDVGALENVLGGSAGARIVPIVSGYTPSTDSWAVRNM